MMETRICEATRLVQELQRGIEEFKRTGSFEEFDRAALEIVKRMELDDGSTYGIVYGLYSIRVQLSNPEYDPSLDFSLVANEIYWLPDGSNMRPYSPYLPTIIALCDALCDPENLDRDYWCNEVEHAFNAFIGSLSRLTVRSYWVIFNFYRLREAIVNSNYRAAIQVAEELKSLLFDCAFDTLYEDSCLAKVLERRAMMDGKNQS